MSVCLCLPFANHEWSALSSATKNKKSDEKERLLRKKLVSSTTAFGFWTECDIGCGPKAIFNSFLSASARRPLHMLRRKGGQTSSSFTLVSDGSFRRTLEALRDAASVLAFPFKIFEEGPSLSLRKGESAYMYGDGKQTNPGACHGEARLPASCCELLLPSFVWRASMHTAGRSNGRFFFERLQRANGSRVDLFVDHCIRNSVHAQFVQTLKHETVNYHNKQSPTVPYPKCSLRYALRGWEKKFHTHAAQRSVAKSPPRALRALSGDLATSASGWGMKL